MAIELDSLLANGTLIKGKEERFFLDRDGLLKLKKAGVRIGSHAATHRALIECNDEELYREIAEPKRFLENLLQEPVEHFAIPYGKKKHYDQRVLDISRKNGFKYLYTTNPTFFRESTFLIPRLSLLSEPPAEITFLTNRPMFKTVDV